MNELFPDNLTIRKLRSIDFNKLTNDLITNKILKEDQIRQFVLLQGLMNNNKPIKKIVAFEYALLFLDLIVIIFLLNIVIEFIGNFFINYFIISITLKNLVLEILMCLLYVLGCFTSGIYSYPKIIEINKNN